MLIGVLKEKLPERRVVLLPEAVKVLIDQGNEVWIEEGAGVGALQDDHTYTEVGAVIKTRSEILPKVQILLAINAPEPDEFDRITKETVIICLFNPLQDRALVDRLNSAGLSAFSLDLLPRTTRAQAMDTLSSMATVAGYKAVLTAAMQLPSFFPMFMTAAGTIKPAKILVLGAGVAGLQVIATARRLGGIVHVFDVRSAVKEEVMSLGGKFVEVEGARDDAAAGGYAVEQQEDYLQRQREAIHDQASKSDVIICTAQIPGRTAPLLIHEDTVKEMKPGSVIVDLAASSGGNCALTQNNQTVVKYGVSIIGESNLPSSMPLDASRMFGKNVLNYLMLMLDKGELQLNFEDDIIQGTCICHQGQIISPRLK